MNDLREMVSDWLAAHGYTALVRHEECNDTCGCGADDLMPCDEPGIACRPAYAVACKQEACEWLQEDNDGCSEVSEIGGQAVYPATCYTVKPPPRVGLVKP